MPLENGKLPDSALFAIPNGRLAKEAAANWLALRAKGGEEYGIWIAPGGTPNGSSSSYRWRSPPGVWQGSQEYWWEYWHHDLNHVARPGTSNHGWGNAVDLRFPDTMRKVIDNLGGPFGWHWGEAPKEKWHVTYRGGGKADVDEWLASADPHPDIHRGDHGVHVNRAQKGLIAHGIQGIQADGVWNTTDVAAANRLYAAWGHEPRDVFDDTGWQIIEGKHPWRVLTGEERRHGAELYAERRIAKRHGGWEHIPASHRAVAEADKAWLLARRREIWTQAESEPNGWEHNDRRKRYERIKEMRVDPA